MKYLVYSARYICILLICGLLAGCGYRAPMYKTAVTENPDTYTSVRGEYRELAALLASDTGMPPTDSNTPSVRLDSIGTAVSDILKDKAHSGKDVRRWCVLRKLRNWLARALVGSIS